MADDNQDQVQPDAFAEELKRRLAEEAAQQAQQPGQPTFRAVDYTQHGAGFIAQPPSNPVPQFGNYLDQSGNNIGPTHDENMVPLPAPRNATGVEGQPNAGEQAFWAANPNGAIVHPDTGELIGLGQHPEAAAQFGPTYQRFGAGIGAPGAPTTAPQEQVPNFVQIPQANPDLAAQHEAVGNRIAQLQNQLRGASPVRPGRFQQSPKESIAQELNTLQRAYNGLSATRQQEQTAITAATNRNATAQKQWLTQRDTNGAQRDLIKLLATTEPGSNERRDGLFRIHNSYEHADQKTQNDLIHEASKNSERATAMAHALAQGYTPTSAGFGPMGESMKFAPKVPDKAQARYDKLQSGIQGHSEALAAQRAEETKTNLPAQPYKGLLNLHAQQREAASLEKRFPGLVSQQSTATPSAAPTPAATPGAHGYDIGVQYGNMVYQGGDPNVRSSWKTVGEQVAQ